MELNEETPHKKLFWIMETLVNGAAGKEKNVTPMVPGETKKPALSKLTVAPPTKKEDLPPLDDRLQRLNELFAVQSKYNLLLSSKQKLSEFQLKKGEENVFLTIEDKNIRQSFTTSNPDVIREVLQFVKKTIDEKVKAVEPLLKW